MKTYTRLLLGLLGAAAIASPGCGFFAARTGNVSMAVRHPGAENGLATKVIPSTTRVLEVSIDGTAAAPGQSVRLTFTDNQPPARQVVTFTAVPEGLRTATATAFSDAERANAIARGTQTFTVVAGQTTRATVEMSLLAATASIAGNWVGSVTDSILVNPTPFSMTLAQTGNAFTGPHQLSSQPVQTGVFSGTLGTTTASPSPTPTPTASSTLTTAQTSTQSTTFTFNMSLNGQCTGSFVGNGSFSGDNMTFTYTGTDCKGTHTNGRGTMTRVTALPGPTPTPTPTPTVSVSPTPTPTPTPTPPVSGVSGNSGTGGSAGSNGTTTAGGGGSGL